MWNNKKQNFKILRKIMFFGFLISLFFFGPMEAKGVACPDPMSGDITITENCVFSGTVVGTDDGGVINSGNITINEGATLTVNANQTIVFSPGSSIVKNGNFFWNTGAKIIKGYIWFTDQDKDSYPATSTPIAQLASTTASQYRRSAAKFLSLFALFSNVTYDADDTNDSIFPGSTCGTPCSVNSNLGLCLPVTAKCLSNCQKCDGLIISPVNIDPGYVCTGLGISTAVSTSDYCTSSASVAANVNNCQYTAAGTNYYGCSGTGSGCEATVRATSGGGTTTCASDQATKGVTSCAAVTASNYCGTAPTSAANVNACQYTAAGNSYTGCTGSDQTCGTTQLTVPGATTTCGTTQATKGVTSCAAVTAINSCSGAQYDCSDSINRRTSYRGCAGSGSSCDTTQRAISNAACSYTACYSGGGCSGGSCVAVGTAQTTGWSAGTYWCGAPNRCVSGTCRACTGTLYDDSCGGCAGQGGNGCWHANGSGTDSCNTICASYGGCVAANWNLDSIGDANVFTAATNYSVAAAGGAPSYYLTAYQTFFGRDATAQDCAAAPYNSSINYRLCVCAY